MEHDIDLRQALDYIDPASLDYQEWISVGMGLKEAGYSADDWEEWSRGDRNRYHSGECARKWNSFHGNGTPITGGTIVQMAMERGFRPSSGGHELEWGDTIGPADELVVVNRDWLEGKEVTPPTDWDPAGQLIAYLETLFEAGENVGYVTEAWEKDGKYLPSKGSWDRTAGALIEALSRCGGDLGRVLGDYNPEAGAWIRFNPLDSHGCKNQNVTDFRYALVESDSMSIEEQNAILHELELPIACLVHSGGKSLHAIVRVEAGSYEEYRKRVDYLYEVCRKNGLDIDRQNRNPSRLSRMPGIIRKGQKQFLVGTNLGKASWNEWREWIESVNDDLPDPESIAQVWNELPELAPPLIDGVLRQGHKLLLAGPSKAGKSFALIELCISIAEGRPWLGFSCARGRVLYVNLELDRASCLHRFKDVYDALGWEPRNISGIDVWNLRGRSVPMDKLAPKLIRRAIKKDYIAVVIDPIYKVITGDENSADQMAAFCNQFDKVCTELGCAVIYCHHHSKGAQGGKRSMDRASGSGVFARDPDAMLDMIELEVSENLRKQELNNAVCALCAEQLRRAHKLENVSQDDLCSQRAMVAACREFIHGWTDNELQAAENAVQAKTAWRIDGTLREFPKFPPVNVWFEYPVHRTDDSEVLSDIDPEQTEAPWKKAANQRKQNAKKSNADKKEKFDTAVEACSFDGAPTAKKIAEYYADSEGVEPSMDTVYRWIKKFGYAIDKNTGCITEK